jgi:hypothetical protein
MNHREDGMTDAANVKMAAEWLTEIHGDLEDRQAQLWWILGHCAAQDQPLVRQVSMVIAPLQEALGRLDHYLWMAKRQGEGSGLSTGTVDVPHPHDVGTGGGLMRERRVTAQSGRGTGTGTIDVPEPHDGGGSGGG